MSKPNGGRAAKSGATLSKTPRATGFASNQREDATQINHSSRASMKPRVPKQAAVNRGVATQYGAGMQKLGKTSLPSRVGKQTNGGQPRGSQSSMRGSGGTSG